MDIHEGKYLVCITRKNGDFYQYHLTDDMDEAITKYVLWRDMDEKYITNTWLKVSFEKRGILNNSTRPHLYLIDLTATDDMITKGIMKDVGQENLRKFKRIKRLYQLNVHLF